jgi:hypothetical protein
MENIMEVKTLDVIVRQMEYVYDELDTNAMNFITDDGYFCISRCVYIDAEEDPLFKKPHIELNEQNGIYCDFLEVLFSMNKIFITLEKNFLSYKQITVNMIDSVDEKTIDFFVNHLFLGDVVKYAEDIDIKMHLKQTNFPEEF